MDRINEWTNGKTAEKEVPRFIEEMIQVLEARSRKHWADIEASITINGYDESITLMVTEILDELEERKPKSHNRMNIMTNGKDEHLIAQGTINGILSVF